MAEDVLITSKSASMVLTKKGKGKGKRSKLIEETESIPLEPIGDNQTSVKQQTKAKFDELLKQAVDQSQVAHKKKRKKKDIQGNAVLESLKLGEGLRKDEDLAIQANTYNPADSPKHGKNKGDKDSFLTSGKDNLVIEDETQKGSAVKKKKKKKIVLESQTSELPSDSQMEPKTVTESTPLTDPYIRLEPGAGDGAAQRTAEMAKHEGGGVKRRMKKRVVLNTESTEVIEDRASDSVESPRSVDDEGQKRSKTKTSKKKQEKEDLECGDGPVTDESPGRAVEDEGRVLGVTIHRTDQLKSDFYIKHPLVRVHVVDQRSGLYLHKQNIDRSASYYYEQENNKIAYILPIMTQPFDFKKNKSTLPVWEELILFNENFNYFVSPDLKVILFFELLDFVSMNTASHRYNADKQEGGWHRIAWGFLKPLGANDKVNVGSKVRLQLFYPPSRFSAHHGKVEVYNWWASDQRRPYPSTLYVTLKAIQPPDKVEPSLRSMFATQQECGRQTFDDLKDSVNIGAKTGTREDGKKLTTWTRLIGQVCKIPNNHMLTLPAGRSGCYVLKFSRDGRYLACACHDQDTYTIYIYNIPQGTLEGEFFGHYGVIYDLCWTRSDDKLMSTSSDGTVRVWSLAKFGDKAERVLPHPSFVYAACFHPRVDTVLVSGGYDQVLRVWNIEYTDTHGQLVQEIEQHRGHVNAVCFSEDGLKLYTADSIGVLIVWNVFVSEQPSRRGFLRDWTVAAVIDDPDLRCVPINFIKLHPGGRRLLLHCRDNFIRMFDLRINRVMQRYIGAMNFREKIRSTISPCGTFVFSGSEDCVAYVWNTDTGDQVAMYEDLNYTQPITDIDYHPRDHIVAFSSLGDSQPVFVYNYDSRVAALGVGFPVVPKEESERAVSASSMIKTTSKSIVPPTLTGDFDMTGTVRLDRARRKLASVAMSSKPMVPAELHPLGVPFAPKPQTLSTASTWGSTFDQTAFTSPRFMGSNPQAFSPHAPTSLKNIIQQQQFSSHGVYGKQTDGWRPTFGTVGRRGARSPPMIGRPPHISLDTSGGNAQFSFQAPVGKHMPKYNEVVALYDYKSQRSDELTLLQGDLIKVLYKDNENWWMGELMDGQQGFFPANYVVSQGEDQETNDDVLQSYSTTLDKLHNSSTLYNNTNTSLNDTVYDTVYDSTNPSVNDSTINGKKKTSFAVKSKQGDLKFMSATEESEEELLASCPTTSRRRGSRERRRASVNGGTTEKIQTTAS